MNKHIEAYQEKFTETRVELFEKLTEYVKAGVCGPREAVDTFAKLTLLSPVEARKYMYLMSNCDLIWNFKI